MNSVTSDQPCRYCKVQPVCGTDKTIMHDCADQRDFISSVALKLKQKRGQSHLYLDRFESQPANVFSLIELSYAMTFNRKQHSVN